MTELSPVYAQTLLDSGRTLSDTVWPGLAPQIHTLGLMHDRLHHRADPVCTVRPKCSACWARYMSGFVWVLLGFWPFFPACAFVRRLHTGAVAPLLRCAYLHAQSYIFIFSSLEKGMSNLLFGFPLLSTPKHDEALFFSFPHFQCNLIRLSTVPFTYFIMNSILDLWNILYKKKFV